MNAEDTLRDAYVPNRRVRLGSDVAGLCAVALLLGLLGTAVTWNRHAALFDLASNPLDTVKLGTGYLAGPVLILLVLPLVIGQRRQLALTRRFRLRLVLAALLWVIGIAVLATKLAGLDGYQLQAGAYVTAGLLVVGLLATLAMWPSGLEIVRVNRKGDLRAAAGKPEASL
jgi:hypothetical protein